MPTAGCTHDRCMRAVAKIAKELALHSTVQGIGAVNQNVYMQLLPDETNVQFPCVLVTLEGEQEEEGDSSFEEDYVIYPVRVLLCDRAGAARRQELRPEYLRWRRELMAEYRRYVGLYDVPECHDVRLKPQPIVDPKLPFYQFFVSGFVVMCHCNEVRQRVGAPL